MPTGSPEISAVRDNDVTVVSVQIENLLGIAEVNVLGAQLQSLLAHGDRKVIVDLSSVMYAGSAALGMLLSIDQTLKAEGGKLVLANAGKIDGLLKVSRTRGVFTIAPDVDAAKQML